jgi:putative membrane protein
MHDYYWSDWYTGWGWVLWFGILFLLISSIGSWGYTYRAHRKFSDFLPEKKAMDILNERYARGEINHEEYDRRKAGIGENLISVKTNDARSAWINSAP